jgi:transcriptional regulator with XRE-family HTH domain
MLDSHKIRERRRALRMTQRELGAQLGQDQSYVSRLERGVITGITVETFEQLARTLGVSLETLLTPSLQGVAPHG